MRPCKVTLDLDALNNNLNIVSQYAISSKIVAMVKANAYGHGAIEIAKALEGKVAYLGVASINEALVLRQAGIKNKILLVAGFFDSSELQLIYQYSLAVVLHAPWQIETLLSQTEAKKIDVWLKYDSGMHRLGLNAQQFHQAMVQLKDCPWVEPDIKIMSHFACADDRSQVHLNQQYMAFERLVESYQGFSYSLANSAAILAFSKSHHHYVRPGLMLYGCSPFEDKTAQSFQLQPVMCFSSEIIALRQCLKGDTVGYGATWRAARTSIIATVAVGYGDGYPRHLSDEAYVLIDGIKCPIVGRISMDTLTVDVTHLEHIELGKRVILWGKDLAVEEVAKFSNTISYDLLCRTGLRTFR